MIRTAIYAGLDRMALRFAVKLTPSMIRRYRVTFEDLPLAVWEEGIENAIRQARAFPKPSDFHQYLPPPAWSKAPNGGAADPDHACNALALIREITAGKLTRAERALAFESMAELYPGIGWERAAAEAREGPPPTDTYHGLHLALRIVSQRCGHCRANVAPRAPLQLSAPED